MPANFVPQSSKSSFSCILPRANLVIACAIGICLGAALQHVYSTSYALVKQQQDLKSYTTTGLVTTLDETPVRKTSHVDEKGRPITKQQLLEPFVVPNFVGYSIATFLPGQTMMPVHEHRSLHEFFYVVEGWGYIQKDGVDHKVEKGWFLHMAPHEKHGIWVPEDAEGPLKMAVCGVTLD
mmetsp:Transcript_12000/g.14999  ORF Transcript_12000/g.14999 Transcript_12000/m.14999 type:complete len:180 (+) Transcript_12000:223-762(+)|eukprot:CAMPEP_0172517718 /NCGR_PEP_ID=MMETSP1066-20121228/287366_1 /TAXON_ID=671091 /ORGANISM="Coscinodiscus wailesii, Strain CCMP2513" /LENGTH=179 /DNA_ID=CAMNT_0013299865 /DNA_START=214 /DNA_END=753 /DNA_ORIENTATION=+